MTSKPRTISQDFKDLEAIITKLGNEQDSLEDSIALFKQGVELIKRLKQKLTKAKLEIQQIEQELEAGKS